MTQPLVILEDKWTIVTLLAMNQTKILTNFPLEFFIAISFQFEIELSEILIQVELLHFNNLAMRSLH